jgi:hypothetical protein
MKKIHQFYTCVIGIILAFTTSTLLAGEVVVVDAKAQQSDAGWSFDVTLEHTDEGWDHYADAWRIVDEDGAVLGTRTLLHPHENEQPFTRSLGKVQIPKSITTVYIEAHDKIHGWSPDKFKLILK